MSSTKFIFLFLIEYLIGSIMFSYIIAKIYNIDLRKFRDGNPGGSNLWRLKGIKLGLIAIFLDYLKGFIPLYFIISKNSLTPFELTLISIAPLLGHIFPPMLNFKGGKGIATTFGIWSALTKYEVPLILGGVYTIFIFIKRENTTPEFDAIRALSGMFLTLIFIYVAHREFINVAILNTVLLIFSHKREIINIVERRQI
ncbi:MAG: glycerol-3-phosphate acyltransferase [Caldisericum sp.]